MANVEDTYARLEKIKKEGLLDTLPKQFRRRCGQSPHRVAMRKKNLGIWNEYTWQDCYQNVKYFALGLVSLGLHKEDKICVVGDNDPESVSYTHLRAHET